jgi:triphosphatase
MASPEEIALKLRIESDGVAEIRRSDWWRKLPARRSKRFHSTYFDTADRLLHDLHISLRTETDGGDTIQTIAMANGGADGAHLEWKALIPDAVPDPSLVIDPALPSHFRTLTASDLGPIFALDVKRSTRTLAVGGAEIDVSLDEGTVSSGGQKQGVSAVELALLTGDRDQLLTEARRLGEVAAARPHAQSLSDIGYGLSGGAADLWSKAQRLHLAAGMTTGDAFRAIVRNCFAHLTANDDCARQGLHDEGVHQCRVALRRLRSLFRIYRDVLRRKPLEAADGDVQWLGQVLGAARDLDVLRSDLLEPASAALDEPGQLAPLLASLADKRIQVYADVAAALSSDRYRNILVDLCALGFSADSELARRKKGADALEQPLSAFATGALSDLHRKLLKRGRDFETLSKEDRHGVRIALKKMRYAVDFFGGIYDAERKDKFFKKLARLQEDLGSMNDVAVAEAKLGWLIGMRSGDEPAAQPAPDVYGKSAYAAGCVLGWHRRRAVEIDEELVEDWHAFARAKPFWEDD